MAIKAEQVSVNQISFGALEDSSYVKSQKQAFISHKNQKLFGPDTLLLDRDVWCSTSWRILADAKAASLFQNADMRWSTRVSIGSRLLCDHDLPPEACWDRWDDVEQRNKNKLFGDKGDKYEYVPIIRQPQVSDDDDEAQKNTTDPLSANSSSISHLIPRSRNLGCSMDLAGRESKWRWTASKMRWNISNIWRGIGWLFMF